MPNILEAESWRIIMNTLHRLEKILQKYLDKGNSKNDKPDFSKIRKKVNENAMNNPAVSEKYKEEIKRTTITNTLPSHQVIRSVNPSMGKSMESNQLSRSKTSQLSTPRLSAPSISKEFSYSEEISDAYADLEILQSALDSLFTSTFMHDDKILIEFLKGLGKLTITMLEESGMPKAVHVTNKLPSSVNLSVIPSKKKETATFGIVRILEVTLINMNRIDLIWDTIIMNEVALITSCKHEWLTSIAMEAICVIIEELFDKRVRTEQLRLEMDIEEAYEQKDDNEYEATLDEHWIK